MGLKNCHPDFISGSFEKMLKRVQYDAFEKTLTLLLTSLFLSAPLISQETAAPLPTHGFAIYGDLKYPSDFKHFDYVNPNAPKGGLVTLSAVGSSFDTFNAFLPKGVPAAGITGIHCSLLQGSEDEPASSYAYLAQSIEVSPDRTFAIYRLNPKAIFSDGSPVSADDVVFTLDILKTKGSPQFSLYYKDVVKAESIDPQTVKFTFSKNNRELPQIVGGLPILSKAFYTKQDFTKADLTIPLGCGPYVVKSFQPGREVVYALTPNWWAKDLPSQAGLNNFDVKFTYYRDETVQFQAFQSGDFDFRSENIAKNWATGYDFPALKEGKVIKKEVTHKLPNGMQLFLFNLRNPLFQDIKVRKALSYSWDFDWVNKNLFFNSYKSSYSFFNNSELASTGMPSEEELTILTPLKGQIPDSVFKEEYKPISTDGSGRNRKNIEIANQLLEEAGWVIKNGARVNTRTGKPFQFTFLIHDPAFERVSLALKRNLQQLGITMDIRTVTTPQYVEQLDNFDFDMTLMAYPAPESPGNEQRTYWSSKSDVPSGFNYPGIKSPAVDSLIETVINASSRKDLVTATKALDRVLIHNYLGIYGYYSGINRIAYWDKFDHPQIAPKDGIGFSTWWVVPEKEKHLGKKS
ncbi:ABC transporter substrate-binding protein [Candidatus Bealeia paramacronuclearis]|uniref:ABC transporter substrate-binding protein n=1 Tax=Candidatus Bealeia paramacronuclearis TaxID=1921001 RepID=A0ABZ2C0V8_9PROT|nr:ABC transporter substrate-binding protein [Candidatus Bealeia paramacronuclearis]